MIKYLDLVRDIVNNGVLKDNRTGVPTLARFALHFKHDLDDGRQFPLLTTKAVNFDAVLYELLWFLSGEPTPRLLEGKTKIWDAWRNPSGGLDSAYGYFWRKYPSYDDYLPGAQDLPYTRVQRVPFFDQVAWVCRELRTNPNSRRMVVNAWYPNNACGSRLPPCHIMHILNVQGDRLHLHMTQRSCDFGLGVPFNIASYATLLMLYARHAGIPAGELSITFVDAHVYHVPEDHPRRHNVLLGRPLCDYDHVGALKMQMARDVRPLPQLALSDSVDFNELVDAHLHRDVPLSESFKLTGYDPHPAIPMRVAV